MGGETHQLTAMLKSAFSLAVAGRSSVGLELHVFMIPMKIMKRIRAKRAMDNMNIVERTEVGAIGEL